MTLYVVVRNDIAPGLQMAQACHATREYTLLGLEDPGENLVALAAPPAELAALWFAALDQGIPASAFREPDLDDALTAVAFGGGARKMLSSFPLALRDCDRLGLSALTT